MQFTTDGLVIREVNVGDNDKMLTILTPERGRMGVMAKGSRSLKSQTLATAQLYTYGNYEIYEKGDFHWLRGGSVIEGFFGLRGDIEKIALAAYLADLAYEFTGEELPSVEILRMTLNAFYVLAGGLKPLAIVKGVYELRGAGFSGFMPELSHCAKCHGTEGDTFYLDVMNGRMICSRCMRQKNNGLRTLWQMEQERGGDERERSVLLPMSGSVWTAVRYALAALPERMFSFSLDGAEELRMFSKVAEEYLLHLWARGFSWFVFKKSLLK